MSKFRSFLILATENLFHYTQKENTSATLLNVKSLDTFCMNLRINLLSKNQSYTVGSYKTVDDTK